MKSRKSAEKFRLLWLIIGVFIAIVVLIALGLRRPKIADNADLSSAIVAVKEPLKPNAPPSKKQTLAEVKKSLEPASDLPNEVKSTILNCTKGADGLRGVARNDDFKTLDEYWQKAFTPRGATMPTIKVLYRNAHVRTPSGEVLRLNLSPASSEAQTEQADDRMTLKLFSTGDDGLPTPMELPPEWQGLDWKDALARFETKGEVIYTEVSETERWDDETSATVLHENGKITQAQLFFGKKSVGCAQTAQMNCRCL